MIPIIIFTFVLSAMELVKNCKYMKHEQKIKQALTELDELKGKLQGLIKPKLEVGKWYKSLGGGLFCISYFDGEDYHAYGFCVDGSWSDEGLFSLDMPRDNFEATSQEVRDALIKEAKRRYKIGDRLTKIYDDKSKGDRIFSNKISFQEHDSTLWIDNDSNMFYSSCIFKNGKWAEVIEQDKFAELKEAHKNGAVIEVKSYLDGKWYDTDPLWFKDQEYRIKPEEEPKVGDVVKAWDDDESDFLIGYLNRIDSGTNLFPLVVSNNGFKNAKPLTKQEAIELLFGKEIEFNQTDLQTIAGDIESLKEKYPQYNITISVEGKV